VHSGPLDAPRHSSRGQLYPKEDAVIERLETVNLNQPEKTREFPLGRFELFRIGGSSIGRASYEPGWRWSEHVAPTAGTELCEVEHLGMVVSGRAAVRMADGTERVLGPGDLFAIPPGHDSWVVGDEPYVSLHFLGADEYAR
jgi:quercetin dioxygenase-like cupin family protein